MDITLDLNYFMFVLVNAIDEAKLIPESISFTSVTTAFIKDHQSHHNFASTYLIITEEENVCYYLRLSMALSSTNHWTIPSSIYLYKDITQNLGWKISLRRNTFISNLKVSFTQVYPSFDDMVDATFLIVDLIISQLQTAITASPHGNLIN